MKISQTTLPSTDQVHQLHLTLWQPEKEIRGTVQLIHGMVEHISRYQEFAEMLALNGFFVIGHDQIGHGESILSAEDFGRFPANGRNVLVADVEKVRRYAQETVSSRRYFLLGHSLGSLILRNYLINYPNIPLTGAIIMGTAYAPSVKMNSALFLADLIKKFRGENYRSKLLENLALGQNNRAFEPARTEKDWLTRDQKIVDAYLNDPLIRDIFTVQAYHELFVLTKRASDQKLLAKIDPALPLLLISGAEDPVGNFGKDVKKLAALLAALHKKVDRELLPADRHEVLNEIDRKETYQKLLTWMMQQTVRT